ncbi:hypothetical protein BT96DRAFT_963585 [Gymnopus androsaceus JB14]|uniref:Large ribosomal subunit protein uL23m n=1 Tax=Gymnopus androsaceus JB14 TaxID=1447944 RepID=A0A6A4I8T7_9AGAR|nr:hypothetical protein BT96DRAFT_963585 [Gymnopus androsaceus JB14]
MLRHVQRICSGLSSLRPYSTRKPHKALVARTASTPLAVRERREKKFGPIAEGETDASPEGFTPSDLSRYERHKALGTLPKITTRRGGDGKEKVVDVSPTEWLKRRNARRSRIRGFRTVRRPVPGIVDVVGQTVYLPNIIFRLVRNHTPQGQDYNPYEATFRLPPSITKTDIRSYLMAVYGVKTTYIRTDLYYGRQKPRRGSNRKMRRVYKRAVVGLVDPFYYPHRMEDMPQEEREKREKVIEQSYYIEEGRKIRGEDSDSWKFSGVTGRGKILAEVAKRRQLKEGMVAGLVSEWQKTRQQGRPVTVEHPRRRKPVKEEEGESS